MISLRLAVNPPTLSHTFSHTTHHSLMFTLWSLLYLSPRTHTHTPSPPLSLSHTHTHNHKTRANAHTYAQNHITSKAFRAENFSKLCPFVRKTKEWVLFLVFVVANPHGPHSLINCGKFLTFATTTFFLHVWSEKNVQLLKTFYLSGTVNFFLLVSV